MDLNLDDIALDIIDDLNSKLEKLPRDDRSELLILQARWHIRDGDHARALDYYKQHLSTYPYLSQSRRLQRRMAGLYHQLGEFELAAKAYEKYARRTNQRKDRWKHFWSLYRSGDYSAALKVLEKPGYVKSHDFFRSGEEVLYWHAKVYERLSNYRKAAEKYSTLLVKYPESYYSVMLKSKLNLMQESKKYQSSNRLITEMKNKLVGLLRKSGSRLIASKLEDLNAFPAANQGSPGGAQLLDYLKKPDLLGFQGTHEFAEDVVYENYPKAFHRVVEPHARRIELDPYLTYSIMKAESDFDQYAISWVGAVGLMQIMPYTGFRIAREMNHKAYRFEDLSKPNLNITYAQYYIKRLLNHFDNNVVLALASYNGGPNAVVRWLDRCQGCELDEFVESITYRETRRYVKKVIKNYGVYKSFYEESLPLEVWPVLEDTSFSPDEVF
jgi:tetratricopeptide (TPR) repeat protein